MVQCSGPSRYLMLTDLGAPEKPTSVDAMQPNATRSMSITTRKPVKHGLSSNGVSPHFSHPLRSGGMNVTPALPQAAAAL